MKLEVTIEGDIDAMMRAEYQAVERAVTKAMRDVAGSVKLNWRDQIRGAGLGSRLANVIRSASYPQSRSSLNAGAMVWSKVPLIIGSHERGATIRAAGGAWLAIPLPAAGKKTGGGRITPAEWQFTKGIRLRFVGLRGNKALLVADDARLRKTGLAAKKRGKRRKDGILTGAATVPIFVLVRQISLRKRLNLFAAAEAKAASLPGQIIANWRAQR